MIFRLATLLTILMTTVGCETVLYHLQQIEIDRPVNATPARITNKSRTGDLTLRPYLFVNPNESMTATIDDGYVKWNIGRVNLGSGLDYIISEHTALSLGMGLAAIDNKIMWGGDIGFGFFKEDSAKAWRLNIDLLPQQVNYSADYKVVTDSLFSDPVVEYFHKNASDIYLDFSLMLTMNTKKSHWNMNYFVTVGLLLQKLCDINDKLNFQNGSFVFIPGVYYQLWDDKRLVTGARFTTSGRLHDADPKIIVEPFIQLDWLISD